MNDDTINNLLALLKENERLAKENTYLHSKVKHLENVISILKEESQ